MWYESKDLIRYMNKDNTFSHCESGLDIWDETEMVRLGLYDKRSGNFKVAPMGRATMGIRTLVSMPRDDEETKKEEHKEEDAQADMDEETKEEQPAPVGQNSPLDDKENDANVVNKKPRTLNRVGMV